MEELQAPKLGDYQEGYVPDRPNLPTDPNQEDVRFYPPRGSEPEDLNSESMAAAAQAHAVQHQPDFSNPGNVLDDRPHFLRIVEGEGEVCGQDGEPWPCQAYQKLTEQGPGNMPAAAQMGATVDLERAARAAGLSVEEFQQRLAQQ